jgi:hypothetical protein
VQGFLLAGSSRVVDWINPIESNRPSGWTRHKVTDCERAWNGSSTSHLVVKQGPFKATAKSFPQSIQHSMNTGGPLNRTQGVRVRPMHSVGSYQDFATMPWHHNASSCDIVRPAGTPTSRTLDVDNVLLRGWWWCNARDILTELHGHRSDPEDNKGVQIFEKLITSKAGNNTKHH